MGLRELPPALLRLGGLLAILSPYLIGHHTEARDRGLMKQARLDFLGSQPRDEREKIAWFVDGWSRLSRPRQRMIHRAARLRGNVTLITSGDKPAHTNPDHAHFPAMHHVAASPLLPMPVDIPPFLDILKYCAEASFTHLAVLSPGPLGMLGLGLGHLLCVPVVAVESRLLRHWVHEQRLSTANGNLFKKYSAWFFKTARQKTTAESCAEDAAPIASGMPYLSARQLNEAASHVEIWVAGEN